MRHVVQRVERERKILRAHYLIVGLAGKQSGQHQRVERVPAPVGAETSIDGQTAERQVANGVERLVAYEFIGEAQVIVGWEALPAEVGPFLHAHPTQSEALGEAMLALSRSPLYGHS